MIEGFENIEENYERLQNIEKIEFHEAYNSGDLSKVKSPAVFEILKPMLDYEKKLKEEKMEKVNEQGNKITVRQADAYTLAELRSIATDIAKARMFTDIQTMEQAFVKIQRGKEIGLAPMTSVENIFMVNGKTALNSAIMAGEIKKSVKYNYHIDKLTNDECVLTFFENGKENGKSIFTLKDAQDAELLGKSNWKHYKRNCLFARALSNGKRWYAPEVCMGAYVYEEMDLETDADGMVLNSTSMGNIIIEGQVVQEGEQAKLPETQKSEPEKKKEPETKPEPAKEKEKEKTKEKEPKKEKEKAQEKEPKPKKEPQTRQQVVDELISKYTKEALLTLRKSMGITESLLKIKDDEFEKFHKKAMELEEIKF